MVAISYDRGHKAAPTSRSHKPLRHGEETMTIKIDSKITAYEVVNRDAEQKATESNVVHMHEQIERPEKDRDE